MSDEEKIMEGEEFKKISDAMALITQAIHSLAERPLGGSPTLRQTKTSRLVNEARAKLGLPSLVGP